MNKEIIEEIKRLWLDGLTALEISERTGTSRNSVIGRVYRMKLAPRKAIRPRQKTMEGRRKEECAVKELKPSKAIPEKPGLKRKPTHPIGPERKKSELREMLAEAWRNTVQSS